MVFFGGGVEGWGLLLLDGVGGTCAGLIVDVTGCESGRWRDATLP